MRKVWSLPETVKSTSELEAAFKRAKSDKTYVISMLTHGYGG